MLQTDISGQPVPTYFRTVNPLSEHQRRARSQGAANWHHDWRHWMLRKEADGSTDRNLEKSMEAGDPVDAFRHWKLQQSLMVCAFNPVKLAEHLAFCIHAFAQMQLLFWVAPATLSKSVE
eukprot:1149467-Pelagomonas_calceolata.AAC.13